jgi:hypothetical protein
MYIQPFGLLDGERFTTFAISIAIRKSTTKTLSPWLDETGPESFMSIDRVDFDVKSIEAHLISHTLVILCF